MDSAGFGEIRPFQVSTEFEMGMYPPGQRPIIDDKDPIPIVPMGEIPPEMTLQSSPDKSGGQK